MCCSQNEHHVKVMVKVEYAHTEENKIFVIAELATILQKAILKMDGRLSRNDALELVPLFEQTYITISLELFTEQTSKYAHIV